MAKESNQKLASRQKVLLNQLLQIYPIQEILSSNDTTARYTIKAIELPLEVTYSTSYYSSYYYYSTSSAMYDDQISTALGYTCHSILMICDYYNISLRYPIIHNSSRSMIQNYENSNAISYPLFKMSLVEKEMLENGLDLLRKNVDGICCMLMEDGGIQSRKGEQINILAKLNHLCQYLLRDGRNDGALDWRSESFYSKAGSDDD